MILSVLFLAQASVQGSDNAEADTVEVWADEVDDSARGAAQAALEALCGDNTECRVSERTADALANMEIEPIPERQGQYGKPPTLRHWKDLPNNWQIWETDHTCIVATSYGMSVEIDHWEREVKFAFWEDSIRSLEKGDRRQVRLAWQDAANDQWNAERFANFYTVTTVTPNSSTRLETKRERGFLRKFAESSAIAFMTTEGRTINAYFLDGSARAIADAQKCAKDVGLARPSDPFAE